MSLVIFGFDFISLKGAYLLSSVCLIIFLYAYIIYLYRAQATGKIDYEKYSRLALQDGINDDLVESCDNVRKEGDNNGLAR